MNTRQNGENGNPDDPDGKGTAAGNVVQIGGNITKLKTKIKHHFYKIEKLRLARQGNTEEVTALLTDLATEGIPSDVAKMVLKMMRWEPDRLEAFDRAYVLVREAVGINPQPGLFDELKPKAEAEAEAKPSG